MKSTDGVELDPKSPHSPTAPTLVQINALARDVARDIEEMWQDLDALHQGESGIGIVIPNRGKAKRLIELLDGGK